jgi:NADPH:quinone reductase-like Zn-dependent oxidoreductase
LQIDWKFSDADLLISDKDQILPNRSSQMRLVVLVTGASGQLGQALHHIAKEC